MIFNKIRNNLLKYNINHDLSFLSPPVKLCLCVYVYVDCHLDE